MIAIGDHILKVSVSLVLAVSNISYLHVFMEIKPTIIATMM